MAEKKKASKKAPATPKATPAKKKGRGGRKPGTWVHVEKDAVKQYRKDAKLSRAKLADILDVSSTSIQNWETGRSIPVKRFQLQLAELMGKPVPESASPAPAKSAAKASARGTRGPRTIATTSVDPSSPGLQATRLTVMGEILKSYLATSQGARVSPDQLVALVGSLRSALA